MCARNFVCDLFERKFLMKFLTSILTSQAWQRMSEDVVKFKSQRT